MSSDQLLALKKEAAVMNYIRRGPGDRELGAAPKGKKASALDFTDINPITNHESTEEQPEFQERFKHWQV